MRKLRQCAERRNIRDPVAGQAERLQAGKALQSRNILQPRLLPVVAQRFQSKLMQGSQLLQSGKICDLWGELHRERLQLCQFRQRRNILDAAGNLQHLQFPQPGKA